MRSISLPEGIVVPRQGFEPWTSALPRMRSTTELSRRKARRGYSQRRGPREALNPRKAVLTGRTERRTPWGMPPSDKDPKPAPLTREQKLAQALRANLRRRKVGERAAGETPAAAKSGDAD